MTMKELREAAERVLAWTDLGGMERLNGGSPSKLDEASYQVAKAYLAEHPADEDEYITEQTLRELIPEGYNQIANSIDVAAAISPDGSKYRFSVVIKKNLTRGQLRRLIAALKAE